MISAVSSIQTCVYTVYVMYDSRGWTPFDLDGHLFRFASNRKPQVTSGLLWPEISVCLEDNLRLKVYYWLFKLLPVKVEQWTPPGIRKVGRPRMTCRWTVTDELVKMKLTWRRLNTPPRIGSDGRSSLSSHVPQGTKRIQVKVTSWICEQQ